jgi:hypothetical protein
MDGLGRRPGSPPLHGDGGRTRPRGEQYFDLIDIVARTGKPGVARSFSPERTLILDLCRTPITAASQGRVADKHLLKQVLDGLHTL